MRFSWQSHWVNSLLTLRSSLSKACCSSHAVPPPLPKRWPMGSQVQKNSWRSAPVISWKQSTRFGGKDNSIFIILGFRAAKLVNYFQNTHKYKIFLALLPAFSSYPAISIKLLKVNEGYPILSGRNREDCAVSIVVHRLGNDTSAVTATIGQPTIVREENPLTFKFNDGGMRGV